LIAALAVLLAGSVQAQLARQVQVIDAHGARFEAQTGPWQPAPAGPLPAARGVILWHFNDPAGIIESCVLSDLTLETWLGINLNNQRVAYFYTTGDGTPVWDFPYAAPNLVSVASAETASLGAVLIVRGGRVVVHGFLGSDGTAPLWDYEFDPLYGGAAHFGLDVAADGSLVAAVAFQTESPFHSKLVILDGTTGEVLNELAFETGVRAVELSDDGSRLVLTAGAMALIYETATLTELYTFSVSGAGGIARISRNGEVVAAGGFNARAFRDTGAGWVQVFSQQESTQWYGAMAISGDGNTLFAGSRNYTNEIITLRIIDLVAGTELSRYVSTPSGQYQDVVTRAEVSQDGSVIAVATWGQETRPHPEVMVFDREGNLIGEIAMPGSAWTVDLSADGRYVIASGKNVHANQFGNGGDAIVLDLGGPVAIEDPGPQAPATPLPAALHLGPNHPNPFNPQTSITFALPRAEHVRLDILDPRGRLVRTLVDERREAGDHAVIWDGADQDGRQVPSGTYIYRLQSDDLVRARTLTLVK